MRIPNLRCPVIVIKRKIIQQSVNEAELLDSFGVQETEYVKPDFVWELCCRHNHSNSNWPSLYGRGYSQRQSREVDPYSMVEVRVVGHFMSLYVILHSLQYGHVENFPKHNGPNQPHYLPISFPPPVHSVVVY
jgi:hypothetical protein